MLVAIPSQAPKGEGVETRRAESKGSYFLWLRDSPSHIHSSGNGSENYSVMNLEVAGSSPAGVATTNYLKPLTTNKLHYTYHSHKDSWRFWSLQPTDIIDLLWINFEPYKLGISRSILMIYAPTYQTFYKPIID